MSIKAKAFGIIKLSFSLGLLQSVKLLFHARPQPAGAEASDPSFGCVARFALLLTQISLCLKNRLRHKQVILIEICISHERPDEAEMPLARSLKTKTQMKKCHNSSQDPFMFTGQSTELVCFRLDEVKALTRVRELGADVESVSRLPMGSFISFNRLSEGSLAGKVF